MMAAQKRKERADKRREDNKREKENRKEKDKKKASHHASHHSSSSSFEPMEDLPKEVFNECKEKMRPVKRALRQLDAQDKKLSKEEQIRSTRRCLVKIGDRINECTGEYAPDRAKQWRSYLWAFVSKFTDLDPKQLYKLYKHAVKKCNTEEQGSNLPSN